MVISDEITVAIGQEDLRRFADHDPLKALAELIWNAFDADAKIVRITTEYNDDEHLSLRCITVEDDGKGFESTADRVFGSFGDSMKKDRQKTIAGRIQHGREGKGRYRALALGLRAEWQSIATDPTGQCVYTRVSLDASNANKFRPESEIVDPPRYSGVTVTITDPSPRANALFDDQLGARLAQVFAPRLLADHDFVIELNGEVVSVDSLIQKRVDSTLSVPHDGRPYTCAITVCAWHVRAEDKEDYNCVFLCSEAGCAVRRARGRVYDRGITYSAFVRSSYFNPSTYASLGEDDLEQGILDPIQDAFAKEARRLVNDLNRELVAENAKTAVEQLKSEDAYPFDREPETPLEKAEQQVFDVLAEQYMVMHPTIREKAPDKKKVLMRALKAALTSGDEATEVIISHVLDLSPAERLEFRALLERVKLPKLISFARTVTNRLDFVIGLEHILFETDAKAKLKERKQLHRILADHLWVFGEEYNMGTDDAGFRNVLKRHREILELPEAAFDPDADFAGSSDIPDLMLYKRIPVRDNEFEFLVVELKAPRVRLGEKEFNQIERYARAVAGDPQFQGKWHFVLVNNDYDAELYKQKACQQHRPAGLLVDLPEQKVWVKRWSEVIGDARGRHEWLKKQLEIQISDKDGLKYLAETHAAHLPQVVLDKVNGDGGGAAN